jgi:hypothetical protein
MISRGGMLLLGQNRDKSRFTTTFTNTHLYITSFGDTKSKKKSLSALFKSLTPNHETHDVSPTPYEHAS